METIIKPPEIPLTLTDGFLQSDETTIVMKCHDRIFRDVEVLGESEEVLFTVSTKPIFRSSSWRRTIKDATGTPLLHLRRNTKTMRMMDCKWIVEDAKGSEICSMQHPSFFTKKAVDVRVNNKADKDKMTLVEVRPKDQVGLTMSVNVEGAPIAEFYMKEVNIKRSLDRSTWKARVAGGVDLSLNTKLSGSDRGYYALSRRDAAFLEHVKSLREESLRPCPTCFAIGV